MEVWAWVIVDSDAPDEIKAAQRIAAIREFSPSGIFEQDDGENWSEVQQTMRGHVSRNLDLNYKMALGHETEDARYPGKTLVAWAR